MGRAGYPPPLACCPQGEIAQLVEHTTENRGVPGSSPGLAITEGPAKRCVWRKCPRSTRQAKVVSSAFSCLFSAVLARNEGAATPVGRHHLRQVMHDPVDIRQRIDRLVARIDRRDDYGQLLASGQVIHEVEDVDDV